jgi:adenosine deaminase
LEDARKEFGITSKLIMCFPRHLPEEQAFEALECACKHKEHIFAVGLDSTEKGTPPRTFARVFDAARRQGFTAVAHVGEEGTAENVREALISLVL